MRRFEIFLDSVWHDITGLYVPGSLTISDTAMNSERSSSVSSCSFRLRYDRRLDEEVLGQADQIPVRIWEDIDIVFDGFMDPVMDTSWSGDLKPAEISVECVDFSVRLDEDVMQSASYPAAVDGPSFWIFRRDVLDMSLLYRILEIAGLADRIAQNAPDIDQKIQHVAWNAGGTTYRELIDGMLSDYGWCLITRGEKISWVRTACASIGNVDDIWPEDIVGQVGRSRSYITSNGVSVEWSKLKVMEDALLWRGDLPIGDTSDPRPGEPIASDDYWPEDSDIIETWQNYGVDYLDVDWLEGRTRLKNDELALVSSSDWVLKDRRDDGIVLDPVEDGHVVVYEALRARLRYHNESDLTQRLYYSQINGKALVKTHKVYTKTPEGCTRAQEYRSTYIYDQDSAERLARIRWMWMTRGMLTFSFSSCRRLLPGDHYRLHQEGIYDGFVQIASATVDDSSDVIRYVAFSTAPFTEVRTISTGSQGSGNASPGQDGATNRYVYIRSYDEPATPVGEEPAGWTFDIIPKGVEPVWMSTAKFASTGNLIGEWTIPVRMTGYDKGAYRGARGDFPDDPADGDFILYTGPTTTDFQQYHIYKFVAVDGTWVETIESDKVMAAQYDALQIAKKTGELIYAAMIVVELLVARKLMVGGGTLDKGLLMRFLDDDGSVDHKPVIEIRNEGEKLFWIDVDTGRMYGNFARVVQYMPFTFNDSVDSSHPAVFDFYIPEGEIDYVQVRVRAQKYRTYSTGVAAGGSSSTSYNISWGFHAPSIDYKEHHTTISLPLKHTHGYSYDEIQKTGDSFMVWPKNANTSEALDNITENISIPYDFSLNADHSHAFDFRHSHDTLLGIIEAETATNMSLSWSNGDEGWRGTQGIVSGQTYSLGITSSGWKSIRVASSTRGRVQVQVILKIRIDTEQ